MEKLNFKRKIAVPDFYAKGEHLYDDELGWQECERVEARSNVSKKIFWHHVVDVGLNLAFYYVDNDTFYGLHTERLPIEFKILPRDRSIESIASQCECDTHADGEVLYQFDSREEIWDTVKINGKSLEEVLNRSTIITLN